MFTNEISEVQAPAVTLTDFEQNLVFVKLSKQVSQLIERNPEWMAVMNRMNETPNDERPQVVVDAANRLAQGDLSIETVLPLLSYGLMAELVLFAREIELIEDPLEAMVARLMLSALTNA